MLDPYNNLARILRVKPEVLLDLENKMSSITGQEGVIERVFEENELLIKRVLSELGLNDKEDVKAQEVYDVLKTRLIRLDKELYEVLGNFNLETMSNNCGRLCETALDLVSDKTGFFIKKEKAVELLDKNPPQNLLDHFGYSSAEELIDKETFESVFSALRFTQSTEWMHNFFDSAYNNLTIDDFEERPIELKILERKWLDVAEKFLEKKYHNVSHLKELGIIFIIPLKLDTQGEALRLFSLILHYLNEVPFYSRLFKKFAAEDNFIEKLKSLLRGDVPEISQLPPSSKESVNWMIVQRYLAKDDKHDPRLFIPHINPEAEHWYKAEESLAKLSLKDADGKSGLAFGFWKGLDFVGDYFKNNNGEELVSFDLIDLIMTLVKKERIKYLYHQQESLWNKIFIEYFGREKLNKLIEENIIKGYIEVK